MLASSPGTWVLAPGELSPEGRSGARIRRDDVKGSQGPVAAERH